MPVISGRSQATNFFSKPDLTISAGNSRTVVSDDWKRAYIVLQSPATNSGILRIGDSVLHPPSTTRGIILNPGDSVIIHYKGSITAYNPGASTQTIVSIEFQEY